MSSGNKFATSEEDRTKRHKTVDDIASRSMNQPLTSRGWRPKRFIKEEGTQTPLITQHTRCFQLWPYGCCLNWISPNPYRQKPKGRVTTFLWCNSLVKTLKQKETTLQHNDAFSLRPVLGATTTKRECSCTMSQMTKNAQKIYSRNPILTRSFLGYIYISKSQYFSACLAWGNLHNYT